MHVAMPPMPGTELNVHSIEETCPSNRFGIPYRADISTNRFPVLRYSRYRIDGTDNTRYYAFRHAPLHSPLVQYHVLSSSLNGTNGIICAIDVFDSTNTMKILGRSPFNVGAVATLGSEGRHWKGVDGQYVRRREAFGKIQIYDYYRKGIHCATVAALSSAMLPAQIEFRNSGKQGDCGKATTSLGDAMFYHMRLIGPDSRPFVDNAQRDEIMSRIEGRFTPGNRQIASAKFARKLDSLINVSRMANRRADFLEKTTTCKTIDILLKYAGMDVQERSLRFSADARTVFGLNRIRYHDPLMDESGVELQLESFYYLTSVFLGADMEERVAIPCGRDIPARLNKVSEKDRAIILCETYDVRRKIVKWFPDCVAMYEDGTLSVVHCSSHEIIEGVCFENLFHELLKVLGHLSPFCNVHESFTY